MTEFRKRSWANVSAFVKERLKRAPTDFEDTRVECLYAHYKKWAFFRGEAAVSDPVFCSRLEQATKLTPYEFRGHRMYQAMILDLQPKEELADDEQKRAPERIVKGQVRSKKKLNFLRETIPIGHVLDWMEPSDYERTRSKSLSAERGLSPSVTWLVVEFAGKRRYVSSEDVEKVH